MVPVSRRSPSLCASIGRRLLIPLFPLLLLGVLAGQARADKVDALISEMTRSDDYKVRLSAALNLAKLGNARAIPAFITALRDRDKTVRGVAAAALGKLVTSSTPATVRDRALEALGQVARKDGNSFVRKQAKTAYDTIKSLGSGARPSTRTGVYVNVGDMSDSTSARMKPLMRKTVLDTFRKKASRLATSWPGGKTPSKRDLASSKTTAFFVDGTLTQLQVSQRGSSSIVSCKVSMLLATFPEKSMFGFLKGGASVQAGTTEQDINYAKQDCVVAVVEDLVGNKIIPTISQRVP